ncbi:hypothetical protein [Cystobacter ferrugineus]|uniref:Squalene cyclase C-terminal domain-containing protein n=1 Tax=Cystobacter ferrugineus TaxID=83449 RepID=A0A1L9B1U9_9BACT|nr:hypothetical protein [Cystobacter ferrugineus]OJH36245.1 hypothetical protein BON30_34370 [Cystobacter ferrugineus]
MLQSFFTSSIMSRLSLQTSAHAVDSASLIPRVRQHFHALLADTGDWNLSVYDLAWVLCCGFFNDAERDKHLTLLLSQQDASGAWGDASYMPHSALVDTLAVAMALLRLERPVPRRDALGASVEALLARCREYPHHDTVAFELLVPKLLKWLERHQLHLPLSARSREFIEALDRKGDKKLELLRRAGRLFDAGCTLSYTAELAALIPLAPGEEDALLGMMLPNGAIGLSPAATAAVMLLLTEKKRKVPARLTQYLRDTFDDYRQAGFPNLHPITTSRRLWNVRPWLLSGNFFEIARDESIREVLVRIYQETNIDEEGRVSWDTNNSALPDLDDTAVAFALYSALTQLGVRGLKPMSTAGLLRFQREDGTFFCYPHELHPSPSALLHSLLALELAKEAFGVRFTQDPATQTLSRRLLEQLRPEGQDFEQLHHDKWHATWTYGVQKWLSLEAVRATYPAKVREILTECLARERGGGWGQQAPTLEESAYVASGLVRLLKQGSEFLTLSEQASLRNALGRARDFLCTGLGQPDVHLPALWISKNVYTPRFQSLSAVLDALFGLVSLAVRSTTRGQ